MIALDINGTLLRKIQTNNHQGLTKFIDKEALTPVSIGMEQIFLRPHLKSLSTFLNDHKISYVFWSTCKEQNFKILLNILYPIFPNVMGCLSFNDCTALNTNNLDNRGSWVKDLNKLERFWDHDATSGSKFDVNLCWLVDDSLEKRMSNQNFMHVKTFDGYPDDEIFRICDQLHDIYKCDDLNCIKKFKI